METRHIVVGDVHGCTQMLMRLLREVGLRPDDVLVLVGDVIDRGPDSLGTIRLLRHLPCRVVLVEGNHEHKFARLRSKPAARFKYVEMLRPLLATLTPEDAAFLDAAVSHFRIPDTKYLVVHGGIPVEMADLEDPKPLHQSKWTRRLPTDPTRSWAEGYDGRFGHVLFGHHAFRANKPVCFEHATGLDLGCVYGGRLAAAVVEPSGVVWHATVESPHAWTADEWYTADLSAGGPAPQSRNTQSDFRRLVQEWHADTAAASSWEFHIVHPAYQRIIGMGPAVVPLLLHEMQASGDGHWSHAMQCITGENPIRPADLGSLQAVAQRWLQWGREHGHM